MIKDEHYYKALDLAQCAKVWRQAADRRDNSAFHDSLAAIAFRCETEPFTATDLLTFVGDPDNKRQLSDGSEVWEYHWVGAHGLNPYTSCTPFILRDGHVFGVDQSI